MQNRQLVRKNGEDFFLGQEQLLVPFEVPNFYITCPRCDIQFDMSTIPMRYLGSGSWKSVITILCPKCVVPAYFVYHVGDVDPEYLDTIFTVGRVYVICNRHISTKN